MYTHQHQKRVRYGETDQMGYLYYGNYAQYYEIGRVEMLRSLGLTYRKFEEELKVMMPVTTLEMRFVRPAKYDELITIQTSLKELPGKFITFHMELFNEANKLVNAGKVRLVFVDMTNNRTTDTPELLIDTLRPYFNQ
jgi:acyl-CoA thioester hydrolase